MAVQKLVRGTLNLMADHQLRTATRCVWCDMKYSTNKELVHCAECAVWAHTEYADSVSLSVCMICETDVPEKWGCRF